MIAVPAPTDQRAGVRPISFVLDNGGLIGKPVDLVIRPEDLTRNEPSRLAVHQTLGRDVAGWVDHFGEGLPSCTISGHTGWRSKGSGMDGVAAFGALNDLVAHEFHKAKQASIDSGWDPAAVKLLFIDTLDNFAWSVVPMAFVLRRSRSRPLLFQYNITLQAVATSIDNPLASLPFFGSIAGGIAALGGAVGRIAGFISTVQGMVSRALAFVSGAIGGIAAMVKQFVTMANGVFGMVNSLVGAIKNAVGSVINQVIGIASDLANVGRNVFRTLNAIANLPSDLKAEIGRMASAFNEVRCILADSLRPRATYEDYTGIYGASNCSSTTGGRQDSPYANMNAFALIQPEKDVPTLNSAALASISSLNRSDPVLAPMPVPELGRHMTNIVTGLAL